MAIPETGPSIQFRACDALLCLLLTGLWTLPTFLNGFPLSYYDTAYYTFNAFNLSEPAHIAWRPLTYSLFLRGPVELFGFTGAIFLQNLIAVGFLLKISRLIFTEISRARFFMVGLLLFFTPLIHVSNFIMPDLFSSLGILALVALFYCEPKSRFFYGVCAVMFSMMHFSNILIMIPLALFHYAKIIHKQLVLGAVALILIVTGRLMFFFPQKSVEESAHYFLYSRMVAFGITDIYLAQTCPRQDLVFCDHSKSKFAIWNYGREPNGVAPSINILSSVVIANQEILTSKLVWTYIFKSFYQSFVQLVHFSRPMEVVVEDIPLVRQFGKHAGHEALMGYTQSKVFNDRRFSLKDYSKTMEYLFLLVSCLALLYLAWQVYRSGMDRTQELFFNYYVAAYVLNSLVIGFFSEPLGRYNNKLIWVFCFLAIVYSLRNRHAELQFSQADRELTTDCADDRVASAS